MKEDKRFYKIENHKLNFIRAWHGHKEQKYILILSGSIKISLVKINNWKKPNKNYKLRIIILMKNALKCFTSLVDMHMALRI